MKYGGSIEFQSLITSKNVNNWIEIQIDKKKGVKWKIMEFKCKSCRSRFSEWGKKKENLVIV